MRPEALAEASDWLRRAERDLRGAERTMEGPDPLADLAAYHAQQAVEKALKAFLVRHDRLFPKTHDLVYLVNACRAIDPDLARFVDVARALNPYAFRFRYPGGPLEPERAEAEEALRSARETVGVATGTTWGLRALLGAGSEPRGEVPHPLISGVAVMRAAVRRKAPRVRSSFGSMARAPGSTCGGGSACAG